MNYRRNGATAAAAGALFAAAAAGMAAVNLYLSKQAERDNPPEGGFLEVQGVRLHYISQGSGPCVLFLHGNGSMIQDIECSGIFSRSAKESRAIVFDRPGYGHSSRPEHTSWTPREQAGLVAEALGQLKIESVTAVGHSWGTLVALELALQHPEKVRGLVLVSGYYFPTARPDVALASTGAIPGIGTILCHTVLPILSRIAWPLLLKNLFSPCHPPGKFRHFPKAMAVRPSHLMTSAREAAVMVASTEGLAERCRGLTIPVGLVCGAGDQVVDPQQSTKLHREIRQSTLNQLLFNGHMVHQTASAQLSEVIEDVQRRGGLPV